MATPSSNQHPATDTTFVQLLSVFLLLLAADAMAAVVHKDRTERRKTGRNDIIFLCCCRETLHMSGR